MGLQKITNFVERTQSRLIEQDKGRIHVPSFVGAVTSEVQEAEDAMYDVYKNCGIFKAIGAQLDVVGLLVGEERVGRTDEIYRTAILARINLNIGGGEPNTIINAIKQFMNPSIIDLSEPYPAYFTIFIQSLVNIPNIASIVKEISPAGVGSSVSTLPDGVLPFILSEARGQLMAFGVQASPLPTPLDNYKVSAADTLQVMAMGVYDFPYGQGLAEIYLVESTLTVDFAGAPYTYNLGDGSGLSLKLINANEDYVVSDFGGRLSEIRI